MYSFAHWSLPLAAFLPIFCAGLAKRGQFTVPASQGGYDNHEPRAWLARQTGSRARANAAQANSFEALPFYLAAMLWALSQQVPMPVLDLLAGAWIASRCAYIACYWHDLSTWRSIVWLVAQLLSLAVFTSPLWGK